MSAWTVPSYAEGWTVPGYVEERPLGAGASGRVVAAVSEVTGQRVAIKYLGPALVRDPSFMWSFRTEAQTLRALDVPQVVQLYDYVEEPGAGAAIVMELVDGVSLHEMIVQRGPTTPESALVVLKGSLLGLAAAHALGIVHRDYKPENVLVDTNGDSKLTDFGVAIKAGRKALTAGTPLYMAPEQWNGAPNSPATDIYAATAVFFECLTAETPFTGKLGQLREQHETAVVPLDRIAPPLQGVIARGMAKNPLERPQSAIAFVTELEATAAAVYGPEWEERGRSQLAERVLALLPLLLQHGSAGAGGTSVASTWFGGGGGGSRRPRGRRRRRAVVAGAIAAAVVISVAAVATAVTLTAKNHQANLSGSSQAATITPTFSAEATVTPPVSASKCTTAAAFAFKGTLTATAPGSVSYQWVYSSGKPGPVRTVNFISQGHQLVTGDVVKTKTAGTGWAEIRLLNASGKTLSASNKASYKLLCATSAGGISATSAVAPATKNVVCGTTMPTFTATGTITSQKAETVTYYWALSDGQTSAPATVTFAGPGTIAAEPMTITPPTDPSSGEAVLVVTGPVAAASAPATYTLSCTAVTQTLAATANVSPATRTLALCTSAAPTFTFSGSISVTKAATVSYYWKLPSGNGPAQTLSFTQAGRKAVTAASYKPASDTASGSGSIVVTSPGAVASNAAAFSLTCGSGLSITTNGATTATVGTAYTATAKVAGGQGAYTWTATGLPAGLTAKAAAGTLTISGTPTAAGTSTIQLSAKDSASPAHTATTSLGLTVSAPKLTLAGGTLAAGTTGTAYSATVKATGGTGTLTYSATGLPAGLAISTAGVISGTPTAAGTSTITVTVKTSATTAQTASAAYSLTVSTPALTLAGGTLAAGTTGVAYSATVKATGGAGTFTYSASGLPAGLAISTAGVISGTPTTAGTSTITVTVKDTASPVQTASAAYSLTVSAPALTLAGGTLGSGTTGVAYSATVKASGGAGTFTYSAGGLPPGLAMSTAGVISGTPTTVKTSTTYTVTVTVTDTAGQTATGAYTITVAPAVVVTASPSPTPTRSTSPSPSPSPSATVIE
jgi:eukaryotic-like serine/threonine-protein kinase